MSDLKNILSLPNGANFVRADLHIHSFGASHDVSDSSMTPGAIVTAAAKEGIEIIALTDHNDISNVDEILKVSKGKNVTVIPGVELSTPQGHLLCYLPTLEALKKFHALLSFGNLGTSKSHCKNGMAECLEKLEQLSGFGILAHVDGGMGFATVARGGATPHVEDVICHPALLGIELLNSSSVISYSNQDTDAVRKGLGVERIKRCHLGSQQYLARVLNSDAHSLKALGRNPSGAKKLTRVKVDKPSFGALKIALEDADARIRIEDQVPDVVPHFIGLSIEGGFLDGLELHLSPNLNCIIGGRGAGKSTTFEAVRCLTGSEEKGDRHSEIWPEDLRLFWRDQAGQEHSLIRRLNEDVENLDDPIDGPTTFPIECYGQGDTARIRREAQNNPVALLSYLDRFIDIDKYEDEERTARTEIEDLQGKIGKARKQVALIPGVQQDLKTKQQQLGVLEKENVKELIELQRKLQADRSVREQISSKIVELGETIKILGEEDFGDEIEVLADSKDLAVGAEDFKAIALRAQSFAGQLKKAHAGIITQYKELKKATDASLTTWRSKDSIALKDIDTKKKTLEARGIRPNMIFIENLTKSEAKLKADLSKLDKWKRHLADLDKEYAKATKTRWGARDRVAAARKAYAKQATDTLGAVVKDLTVGLTFIPNAYSPEAERVIKEAMDWRTSAVPRAKLIIEQLGIPGLIAAICDGDVAKLRSVKIDESVMLSKTYADAIVAKLADPEIIFALEAAEVFDLPKLSITATVTVAGKKAVRRRDFSRLSFGQQQSILLALMLSSKSNVPLIVDQPEDNLDSEFVYKTLVPVLRLAKERRQIIVVTHNANIAVLGDAEQIIVLKSTNEKASIVGRGSIDDPKTRDAACNVLEGAVEAFKTRARIYGVTG